MKQMKSKKFTLIELLIVTVIIGVLAAIIVPNISNFKQDSTTTAMQANIKNIETALTMYSLENDGKMPVSKKPELGLPETLMIEQLHPEYLRSQPKVKGMNYWLDYSNKVWASSADSPMGITYTSDGKLKWKEEENAVSYNVFKTENTKVKSSANKQKIVFVENSKGNEISLPKLEGEDFYLVNSVDNFDLESPPVNGEYQGNSTNNDFPEEKESQKEKFPWPMEMTEVQWKNSLPSLRDDDDSTFHTVRANENYLFQWQGDMANRVFQIKLSTGSQNYTSKEFNFLDKDGNIIPFINAKTDERYTTYSVASSTYNRTIEFVVPRGATQLRVQGTAIIDLIKADFVNDLSLPYAVENVYSEVTKESITLKWSPPTNAANFLKVAVYEGDRFLGYSSNGSFTVNSLYSDTEYQYAIEPISVVGNRGPRVIHTKKTFRPEIVWRGLTNANAFDSSTSTSVNVAKNSIINWEGNLDNRQITITYSSPSNTSTGPYIEFAFFNEEGIQLNSKEVGVFNESPSHIMNGGRGELRKSYIVPRGATSLKFIDTYYTANWTLHDIRHGESLDLPSKLTNIETTSTNNTISLKFNRPKDVTKVAVVRDGKFIAYTTEDIFTDISLYSKHTYNYTFETFNSSGNRTEEGGSVSEKTTGGPIVWSGLSNANAFDGIESTYVPLRIGDIVDWEGYLDNRQITIVYERLSNSSTSPYLEFAFFDEKGNQLPSKAAMSDVITPTQKLYGGRGIFRKSFIVPEGASSLKIVNSYALNELRLYEISYSN